MKFTRRGYVILSLFSVMRDLRGGDDGLECRLISYEPQRRGEIVAEIEVPGVGSGRKILKQLSISALSELLLCLFSQKGKLT